jgi:hypothetical protein
MKFTILCILRHLLLFLLSHLQLGLGQLVHQIIHLQVELAPNSLKLLARGNLSILKLDDH